MITCPVNDWTCPCFDSEGWGKCRIKMPGNEHLNCEFLPPVCTRSISRPTPSSPRKVSRVGVAIVRAMIEAAEV